MSVLTDDRTAGPTAAAASQTDVVVVGGGIGGLAAALALTRAGQHVRVLEQAATFGEVGAGLQLAPNASRVLREWGVLEQARELGVAPRRMVMRDAVDGSELTSMDLADVERRYGAPYLVIHRTDLHSVLLEACRQAGVELVTGARVLDVEVGAVGVVADGGSRRDAGQVLIAADGLGSKLRSRLAEDSPISSSYVAYRGAVPISEVPDSAGVAMQDVTVFVGPGCHLVQYPLRRGEMLNQVAVFQSAKALAGEDDWGTPDELDAAFAGTCDHVQRGLPLLNRDRWWQMYDRLPIARWVDRRLVLAGDSAHPMLQYLAQGACQALEDASTLAASFDAAGRDWDAALTHYEQDRTVRTARVQTAARLWGETWHCDGTFRFVRNLMLRDRAVDDYRHVDWLYGPAVA